MTLKITAVAAALCAALASPALAHISFDTKEGPVGGTYTGVLNIEHGCEGSPTTTIRIQVPDGVILVEPSPTPGWELETVTGLYAEPIQHGDETLTEGAREIVWSGGSLPEGEHARFSFQAQLPPGEVGAVIRFPIVQECEEGVHRWIEIPAEGQDAGDLEEPAPGVTLTAPASNSDQ
jgi:uncharacterized protein YcnI